MSKGGLFLLLQISKGLYVFFCFIFLLLRTCGSVHSSVSEGEARWWQMAGSDALKKKTST